MRVQLHFQDSEKNKPVDAIHMITLDQTHTGKQKLSGEQTVQVELDRNTEFRPAKRQGWLSMVVEQLQMRQWENEALTVLHQAVRGFLGDIIAEATKKIVTQTNLIGEGQTKVMTQMQVFEVIQQQHSYLI